MKLQTKLLIGAAALLTAALAAQAQVPGVNSTLNSVFTLAYDNSTMKPTYSATSASLTPASAATDICGMTGSSTKTVKVRRIIFTGNTAAAAVTEPVAIVKRSTANSGGTSALLTKVPYDSANSASTVAWVETFSANPTMGTLVGVLADINLQFMPVATATSTPTIFQFGALGQPIVLRGVAQQVSVNLGGVTFTGGVVSCTFEWTEE